MKHVQYTNTCYKNIKKKIGDIYFTTYSLFSNNSFEDEAYNIENEPLNKEDKLLSNWKGSDHDDNFYKNK